MCITEYNIGTAGMLVANVIILSVQSTGYVAILVVQVRAIANRYHVTRAQHQCLS